MESKTSQKTATWIEESTIAASMQSSHSNQLLADSVPNAIGALVEYEALNCNNQSSIIEFSLCLANQNQ